jgi:hypothetical protein
MGSIIKFVAGLLTGKAGESVGGAVSVAAQFAALLAALVPLGLWISGNKDEVFITLTYGDLVFWVGLAVLQLMAIRLVHRAPPPGQ